MRVAIIGSRNITLDVSPYIPEGMTELISGGARGIDECAERYADENNLIKLIIKPEYGKYGRRAPLARNKVIVDIADHIVAVWDGVSTGTKHTIDYARKTGKPVDIHIISHSLKKDLHITSIDVNVLEHL